MDSHTVILEKPWRFERPPASVDVDAKTSRRGHQVLELEKQTQPEPNLAWSHSDEASNDFRSDIFTKPTLPMLDAIINTTLGDNVMEED